MCSLHLSSAIQTSFFAFFHSVLSPVRYSFLTRLPIANYTKPEEAVQAWRIQVHKVGESPAWRVRRVDSPVPGAQWAVRRCYWAAATLLFKVVYVGSVSTRKIWRFWNSLRFGFPRLTNSPRVTGNYRRRLCAQLYVKQESTGLGSIRIVSWKALEWKRCNKYCERLLSRICERHCLNTRKTRVCIKKNTVLILSSRTKRSYACRLSWPLSNFE